MLVLGAVVQLENLKLVGLPHLVLMKFELLGDWRTELMGSIRGPEIRAVL